LRLEGVRVGEVLGAISDAKNALVDAEEAARLARTPAAQRNAQCYGLYQEELARNGALDFDDLIGQAVRLFRDHREAGVLWAERFRHVLVDEYQDTNHAQFRLVQFLAARHRDLFAVGDDDQSIYGFRGANLAHVLDFEQAFPGARVVRLEQNYRSTRRILAAANAVIANNQGRSGKNLWCDGDEGALLSFVLTEDEVDEARRVRGFLQDHLGRGGRLVDCAVLYRTNAQSRALETELRLHHIAYQMVGGISFYQRREVKDLLAYLRLAVNPADAVAFWRVWNTPRRGLGERARAAVEARAGAGVSLLDALRALAAEDAFPRPARGGAVAFLEIVDGLRAGMDDPVDVAFARLLEATGYLEYLDGEEDAEERRSNVRELAVAAEQFAAAGSGGLPEFLAEAALVTDGDRVEEAADRTLLLTTHNAKGLEFPVVIVAGLEEGLFPHATAVDSAERLEEERRLFYVALTRARRRVILTAAAYRRRWDTVGGGAVSRFVHEIPSHLIEHEDSPRLRAHRERDGNGGGEVVAAGVRRPRTWGTPNPRPARAARSSGVRRSRGREVYHESFGRGVVMDAEGEGTEAKYTVRFGTRVIKVLGRFLTAGGDVD
jgi:DNA helicase-2/ATP-dependent DNA helicase PcrA